MALDEESLEIAANGGPMDLDKWPSMVEPLLERLEYIVYNVFAMPEMPPEAPSALHFHQGPLNATSSFIHDPNSIPSSSNKENAAPQDLQTPPRPPPGSMHPPSSTERVPDSMPASQTGTSNGTLQEPLSLLLQHIQSTLRSLFPSKPPHTIQRLAELILRPNAHYRTLPAYLRAVDRVVSVTSSADMFPLQTHTGAGQPNGVRNGSESTFGLSDHALASDESLGGALLTPIPWLNNAASLEAEEAVMDEGPIATTAPTLQHQLLTQSVDPARQEAMLAHSESTVLQGGSSGVLTSSSTASAAQPSTDEPSEEIPHARGPSVLGIEDMGLQNGKGVQMTLRDPGSETAPSTRQQEQATPQTQAAAGNQQSPAPAATASARDPGPSDNDADADADGDGDICLSDEPGPVPSSVPQPQGGEKDQQ